MAGLARIVEICFIAPEKVPTETMLEDSHSERTLADSGGPQSPREPAAFLDAGNGAGPGAAGKAFRHLPPFVSFSVTFFVS